MRIVLFVKNVIESQSPFQLSLVQLILRKKTLLLILLMKILIENQFIKEYSEKRQFAKFLFNNDVPVAFLTLNIFSDVNWTLYTHQKQVLQSLQIMKKLPKLLIKKSM